MTDGLKAKQDAADREEIVRMAREAGIKGPEPARLGFKMYANPERLKRFAALVAAAEREACAKVCDEYAKNSSSPMNFAENCAATIRNRGTA